MAMSFVEEDSLSSARMMGGEGTARRIFRFGGTLTGERIPTVPARYRSGPGSPSGTLVAVRLRPTTGDGWIRLRTGQLPWRRLVRTIPLREGQPPAPTPDTVDLRGGATVRCHDGEVGRLRGIVYDARSGLVLDLLVRVRRDIVSEVTSTRDPMAALLDLAGREILVSPTWAVSTTRESAALPLRRATTVLLLNASAEQIGAATLVRTDGQLAHGVLEAWGENPALAPYTSQLSVEAHDGDVTLSGTLPSPRQRATAEQDAWHVAGVLAVHNLIRVEA
jgi:hypothetical protein